MERAKTCRGCGEKKPVTEFSVKEKRGDYLHYFARCRPCNAVHTADLRRQRLELGITYRDRGPKLTDRELRMRRLARQAINNAVYKGKLVKPTTCERCSRKQPVEGHHHKGYEHKFDVLWLCGGCHRSAHAS